MEAKQLLRKHRARVQRGYVYEAGSAFFVRYYVNEIVDGQVRRVQRSERLCSKDDKHHSPTAKPVVLMRDKFMLTINEQAPGQVNPQDTTVAEFWEKTYLPFAEANLRLSTVRGYKKLWKQHLKSHFGDMTLRRYKTHLGSQFLTALAKNLGRRSLAHIRSLASGVFTHAVNLGVLESNPWHEVKILGKVKDTKNTPHYTLEEVENIISALVNHVQCQLVFALAFFLGLRPGEIAGLRWEDVDEESVHIRRAFVERKIGPTKTPESVASLPLIEPVKIPLKVWREKCGNPSAGFVFPNKFGRPFDLDALARKIIMPVLKASNLEWKGLYAGRRGAGTILTELTGSAIAAQQILRHKNLAVTTAAYVKAIPVAGIEGMKLLELAAANGNGEGE